MLPNYLVEVYLSNFIRATYLAISVEQNDSQDKDKIKEVSKTQRKLVIAGFMQEISDMDGESICQLVEKLDAEITEWTEQFVQKQLDRKKESKLLLGSLVCFLTNDFESSIQTHLSVDPFIEVEQLEKFLESTQEKVMNSFLDHWKPGSAELHKEFQAKLESEIGVIRGKALEQQKVFLEGPAAVDQKSFVEFKDQILESIKTLKMFAFNRTILTAKMKETLSFVMNQEEFSKPVYRRAYFQIHSEFTVTAKNLDQVEPSLKANAVVALLDRLMSNVQRIFLWAMESNQMKIVRTKSEIKTLLAEMSLQYATEIEKAFQKSRHILGHDLSKLERDHNIISNRIMSSLPAMIRKINPAEPTEGHRCTLMRDIEKYWMSLKEAIFKRQNILLKLEKKDKQKSLERLRVIGGRPSNLADISEIVDDEDNGKGQLVFKISYPFVTLGACINGEFEIVETHKGENKTPLVVGKTSSGELVYGKDAEKQCKDSLLEYWCISDYLGSSNFQISKNEISFQSGNAKFTAVVSVEFLLGFILKSLKEQAEQKYGVNFKTALITVPIWFTSTHRIKLKDAGKVAGFVECNLIHEESAAALAYLSERAETKRPKKAQEYLLVLSENVGAVSAVVYSISLAKFNRETLEMFAINCSKLNMDTEHADLKESVSLAQTVWQGCRLDADFVSSIVVLTESPLWRQVFKNVAVENKWTNCMEMCEKKFMGVLREKFSDIRKPLKEYLQLDVYKKHSKGNERVIYREEAVFTDSKPEICSVKLKYGERETDFFQKSALEMNEEVSIGKLQIGRSIRALQNIRPVFEICCEGIVTLKEVRFMPSSYEESESDDPNDWKFENTDAGKVITDFTWTTTTLTNVQINKMKKVVESMIKSVYKP